MESYFLFNMLGSFIGSAIILLLLKVFGILEKFASSYGLEKGKNIATKQDIGEITTTIETIKGNINKDIEQLKGQLSFINSNKTNILTSERESLIVLNAKVTAWLYELFRFSFFPYDYDNYSSLDDEIKRFTKLQIDVDFAESQAYLLRNDDRRNKSYTELVKSLIEMEMYVVAQIIEMKMLLINHSGKINSAAWQEKPKLITNCGNEQILFMEKFTKRRLEIYESANKLHIKFSDILRDNIISITS